LRDRNRLPLDVNRNSLPLFEPIEARPRPNLPQRHLAAARRLSKRIAKFADQSPEQLRTGRLICRHLVAMLKEIESNQTPH